MHTTLVKPTIKLVLAAFFLGCLADWPYGYYQFVRFAGMVGFVMLATLDKENQILLILWVSSAVLINPFLKIHLGREVWNLVDVLWAVVLLASFVYDRKRMSSEKKQPTKEEV